MESRMQGDLHVRFGGRLWETYHRKVVRRPSPSLHRKNGSLMWRHKTGSPILTTVAVSGKTFFGTDFSGNIYCFKAE